MYLYPGRKKKYFQIKLTNECISKNLIFFILKYYNIIILIYIILFFGILKVNTTITIKIKLLLKYLILQYNNEKISNYIIRYIFIIEILLGVILCYKGMKCKL